LLDAFGTFIVKAKKLLLSLNQAMLTGYGPNPGQLVKFREGRSVSKGCKGQTVFASTSPT